ncbi:hypothetical protein MRX96_021659 [Rhipicephalus microplus]
MQVTVEGSNLGTSQEAIYDKIKIGGIPCNLTEYNVSVSEPGSSAGSEQVGCRSRQTWSLGIVLASHRRRKSSSIDKPWCATFGLTLDSSPEALVSASADRSSTSTATSQCTSTTSPVLWTKH